MRRGMLSGWMRMTAVLAAVATGGTTLLQAPAQANLLHEAQERSKPHPVSELPKGRTDKLTTAQWKAVDAKRDKSGKHKAKLRLLTSAEMNRAHGRGPYRSRGFNGVLPWQKSLRDVNLCTGNLFKSFTDMQVSPARGAGLALQRTYNSNDERVGPFGIGWTHAYDIRMEEDPTNTPSDDSLNFADRTDFFGGKHKYHRDADGLYSPPAYLYDEMSSDYDHFLTDGPQNVLSDTDRTMDGTVKHFTKVGNERVCDQITDRYNNATVLTYTTVSIGGVSKALLDTVTDPSGRSLTFVWQDLNAADPAHPAYRIVRVDGPQYAVAYSYNADFNLSASTLDAGDASHLNRTSTYGYTAFSDENGTETGLLASVSDALGHTVSYGYATPAFATGTVWATAITESAGVTASNQPRTQTFTLAPFFGGPLYTQCTGAGDGVLVMLDSQLRTTHVFPDWYNTNAHAFDYDSANNITRRQSNHGMDHPPYNQMSSRQDYFSYGPHGNQLTHTIGSFAGVETTTYYNASQYFQKASVTDMNGRTSTIVVGTNQGVDPTGQLATGVGNKGSVLYVRDAGYGVSTSPSYNKQFAYQYNANGQKVSETNLNGTKTQYSYGDQWGNLTQVVQDPHVTQGDSHLARTTSMSYDVSGRILSSTDPKNLLSTFSFSSLGQPTNLFTPATVNTPAETISYGYGSNGRTESVTDNRGTTSLTYENGCDRVSSVGDPVSGVVGYTYSPQGQRLTMSLPGGGTWTYAYGNSSLDRILSSDDPNSFMRSLTSITDDQGRRVEYSFDAVGAPQSARFNQVFDGGGNAVSYCQTDYSYDGASVQGLTPSHGWLQQIQNTFHFKNAQGQWQQSTLVQNAYTHDLTGQRLTNTITSSGSSRTEQYSYDELNRLKTVNYGDGQTQAYAFDAMGNRLQKQDSATGTENYSYNAANMLLSRGTNNYGNDANGNTLTGGGRTNTWDSQNRLIQCVNGTNTSSFVYGADGSRHQSTVNGTMTDFVLDASMFVRERNHATGANLTTYLVGLRGPEYRRDDATGQVRWYVYDGLGSVLGEVDPNGSITSSRKYDVYGLVRGGNSPGGTSSHKYVGQLGHPSEDNTGLIYMRSRFMDPCIGRFASEDPLKSGTNWLIYADQNPVVNVDADGRETIGGFLTSFAISGTLSGCVAGFQTMVLQLLTKGYVNWGDVAKDFATWFIVGGFLGAGAKVASAGSELKMLLEALAVLISPQKLALKALAAGGVGSVAGGIRAAMDAPWAQQVQLAGYIASIDME